MKYTDPEISRIKMEDIQPTGWGDSPEKENTDEEMTDNFSYGQTAWEEDSTDPTPPEISVITEDNPGRKVPDFVIHRGVRHNWVAVDIPDIVHISK